MLKQGHLKIYVILDFVIEKTKSVLFDLVEMIEDDMDGPRKAKAASSRVADLMKSLKLRKKGPIDKEKKVK